MFLIRIIFYSKSKFWTLLSTVIWFRKYKEGRFVFFENLIGLQNRVEEGRQFSQRIKSWPISEMFTTAITSPFIYNCNWIFIDIHKTLLLQFNYSPYSVVKQALQNTSADLSVISTPRG